MTEDTGLRAGQCHCGAVRFMVKLTDGFNTIYSHGRSPNLIPPVVNLKVRGFHGCIADAVPGREIADRAILLRF